MGGGGGLGFDPRAGHQPHLPLYITPPGGVGSFYSLSSSRLDSHVWSCVSGLKENPLCQWSAARSSLYWMFFFRDGPTALMILCCAAFFFSWASFSLRASFSLWSYYKMQAPSSEYFHHGEGRGCMCCSCGAGGRAGGPSGACQRHRPLPPLEVPVAGCSD
jgi:hypothetical protein